MRPCRLLLSLLLLALLARPAAAEHGPPLEFSPVPLDLGTLWWGDRAFGWIEGRNVSDHPVTVYSWSFEGSWPWSNPDALLPSTDLRRLLNSTGFNVSRTIGGAGGLNNEVLQPGESVYLNVSVGTPYFGVPYIPGDYTLSLLHRYGDNPAQIDGTAVLPGVKWRVSPPDSAFNPSSPAEAPEPAGLALVAVGLAALRRRRR